MVRVLVRRHAPFAKREPTKQRMNRPIAFARPGSDALHQGHELRADILQRRGVWNQQFRRCRRALRERHYVQDEMLEWKYLKGPLALAGKREFAESHQGRIP